MPGCRRSSCARSLRFSRSLSSVNSMRLRMSSPREGSKAFGERRRKATRAGGGLCGGITRLGMLWREQRASHSMLDKEPQPPLSLSHTGGSGGSETDDLDWFSGMVGPLDDKVSDAERSPPATCPHNWQSWAQTTHDENDCGGAILLCTRCHRMKCSRCGWRSHLNDEWRLPAVQPLLDPPPATHDGLSVANVEGGASSRGSGLHLGYRAAALPVTHGLRTDHIDTV